MTETRAHYWFKAKRYGWGWGRPVTRQGWVVTVVWLAITVAGSLVLARRSLVLFYPFLMVMCGLFLLICLAKGEPPRWRWGDRE